MTDTTENKLDVLVGRIRKVRSWLIALTALKITASAMIFASAYIIAYVLLDHYIHISVRGRLAACVLFLTGMLYLVILLFRNLYRHISFSYAANFVESRMNFDQQLVTVIEYHENRSNYPYSRSLASCLVGQVDQATRNVDFSTAVPKRQIVALTLVVFLGSILVGSCIRNHYVFFSHYLTRLIQPTATIDPIPATTLTSLSDDVITEPDHIFTLSARINGRVPQTVDLVLESTTSDSSQQEIMTLVPSRNEKDELLLTKEMILPEGRYRYRFVAGAVASEWKTIAIVRFPKLTTMTADISFPDNDDPMLQAYTQEIEDHSLEVFKGAHVQLTARTDVPITKAYIVDKDRKEIPVSLTASDTFQFQLDIQREKILYFRLATEQIEHSDIPPLRIALRINEPAEIRLLSPAGDYLTTNVASVPIIFEANDEFGLLSATLSIEIAGQEKIVIPAAMTSGTKQITFGTTLELEEYDLDVGDSILYYATVEDVSLSDSSIAGSKAFSEIYFIEIAPYRRMWFAPPEGLPDQPKQGLETGTPHDSLNAVLEYTRAFIKKTWPLAQKEELSAQDQSKIASIAHDVEYAADQLALIRDDQKYGFDEIDKSKLDEIISYYNMTVGQLKNHAPLPALDTQKQAYQELRRFLLDLIRIIPPPGGMPSSPEGPDRVKIEEQIHVTRYEKEQIDWELKLLSDRLEALLAREEQLKNVFDRFLEQLTEAAIIDLDIHGVETWLDPAKSYNQSMPPDSEDQDSQPCDEQGCSGTMEGALLPADQPSQGQQPIQQNRDNMASLQEQMKLLQARQKDIEQEIENIRQAMEQLPMPDNEGKADSSDSDGDHRQIDDLLTKAVGKMQEFQDKITQSYYQEEHRRNKTLAEASETLNSVLDKMAQASEVLDSLLTRTDDERINQMASQLAEELAGLADRYDESVSEEERREMLNSLEQARKLLESLSPIDLTEVALTEQRYGRSTSTVGTYQSGRTNTIFDENLPPQQMARLMARKFWSIAIQAKERQAAIIEEDPSDIEFHLLEKQYFESAAKFNVTKDTK